MFMATSNIDGMDRNGLEVQAKIPFFECLIFLRIQHT